MTPSPPDEAIHFRGKTLTPESPRPMHIPEPSNIPILENQMDPVFNDTATYQRSEGPHCYSQELEQNGWSSIVRDGPDQIPGPREDTNSSQGVQRVEKPPVKDQAPSAGQLYPYETAEFTQPTANMSQNLSNPSHTDSSHAFLGSHYPNASPVDMHAQAYSSTRKMIDMDPRAPSSDHPQQIEEEHGNIGPASSEVNLQILLDNLSQSSASANQPITFPAPTERMSEQMPPAHESARSSIPSTLNAASGSDPPAAQIHSGYTQAGETAPPPPFSNLNPASNAYATPVSNESHQPNAESSRLTAPGTESGVVGLSPPPTAKFQQQNFISADEPKVGQDAGPSPKRARVDRQIARGSKAEDDQPWGPEVQKKYDEFLHQERIYVTEGLWDRFPNGSRLFVGKFLP